MSHTKPSDIAVDTGRSFTTGQTAQVQSWIDTAERRLGSRIPDLGERLLDPIYLATFKDVVVAIVSRKVYNPAGKARENVDDYGYGFFEDLARPDLRPTADEWQDLSPSASQGAFSTRPRYVPDGGC